MFISTSLYARGMRVQDASLPALYAWTSRAKHAITRGTGVMQPWLAIAACHHVEVYPRLPALKPIFTSGQDADHAPASVPRPYHG